jgi:hypothetical protein
MWLVIFYIIVLIALGVGFGDPILQNNSKKNGKYN